MKMSGASYYMESVTWICVSVNKTTPEKFWVVHDFVKMNPLYEVVNDIRRFLTSTKELVILDFHRYENL